MVEIVKRPAGWFGGLVVPNVPVDHHVQSADLLEFSRDRIRQRGKGEVTTVYVAAPEVGYTAVIGYPCAGVEELEVGDSMVHVPAGYFAVFRSDGAYGDPIEDVWSQAEESAAAGEIDRAFTEEIEIVRGTDSVELYISLR